MNEINEEVSRYDTVEYNKLSKHVRALLANNEDHTGDEFYKSLLGGIISVETLTEMALARAGATAPEFIRLPPSHRANILAAMWMEGFVVGLTVHNQLGKDLKDDPNNEDP